MQTTFWDVPSKREASYFVYHDESGSDTLHARFLFQGALFVPEAKIREALSELTIARAGYKGQIHFSELRDRTSSKKGAAARSWLSTYFNCLAHFCPYKCMIVDKASKHPKVTRYTSPHELYNYTTKLAIRGGVAWSFRDLDRLALTIFSEKMDRSPSDNFVTYLPREIGNKLTAIAADRHQRPEIAMCLPKVQLIEGDPERVAPENLGHCEFIQLTDLLTSAVAQAINASAQQTIKLDVGKFVAHWISDTRLPVWTQSFGLHRHFSVSCFPGPNGDFYDVPLRIEDKEQLKLLE